MAPTCVPTNAAREESDPTGEKLPVAKPGQRRSYMYQTTRREAVQDARCSRGDFILILRVERRQLLKSVAERSLSVRLSPSSKINVANANYDGVIPR